ncbi:MAG: hypothetical protein JWQ57_3439 [Mucilaginibacter sp.]|nr:hypothetical protein [Mucilaginibacter sp.]
MCKPVGKYPGFHKIEIIAELETPVRKQAVLRAVKGNCDKPYAQSDDSFSQFIPKNEYTPGSVLIRKLSGSSLVVSFYSNAGRTYGLKYLWEVSQLQHIVGALGGQLTVAGPNEPEVNSAMNIGGYGLNLHFYFDLMDIVADRFRIYPGDFTDSDSNPTEENNILTLAGYIIDSFYKVVLSLMDIGQNSGLRRSELQYA